jgi:hypothetical protein
MIDGSRRLFDISMGQTKLPISVADPDPDPRVLGLPDPDPLV